MSRISQVQHALWWPAARHARRGALRLGWDIGSASYSAARQLIAYGYRHVYRYRDGMEGWQSAHETAIITPDADWLASKPVELTEGR